ncbi:MAG: trypsin-like peptidase domain-containing protein [Kineosporiaceae bacterium]|nr:trypsin-like peptidase domain-containing protein [Aeromicrobium sp.]
MSDTNDPFAATPYVPPSERPADNDDTVKVPASAESSDSPASDAPTGPETADAPAPAANKPEKPDHSDEAATVAQPVAQSAPQPPPAEEPAAVPPVTPTASSNEPTEQFVHHYPAGGSAAAFGATAAAGASTQQLPPFPTSTGGNEPPKQKKKRGRLVLVAGAIILLGVAGGAAGAAGYEAATGNDSGVVSSLDSNNTGTSPEAGAVEKVAQKVLPSVVQINVKGATEAGSGTGIIISSDGDILTNNHVVESAADSGTITVSFNDGSISQATILGRDPVTDLAVIKAKDKSGLTPATLGSSGDLKVGQDVVAIGSPFGLESTVTSGIVSALNRPVSSSDGSGNNAGTVFPAVQTDAAINPGNSGGPLVDLEGRVVAINSAIRTNGTSSADSGSIGLGFAIPIDLAKSVSKQLVKGEKVQHARIGITVGNSVSGDGITTTGAEVKDVTSDGAGDKAGIKKGDIITALNGNPVASADGLVASIRGYQPGEKVTLTYLRDGKKQTTDVTLSSDGGSLGS